MKQTIGAQRATAGASGVAIDSGSILDAQTDTSKFGALDQATIRNNAAREAWGITTQSTLNADAAKQRSAAMRTQAFDTLINGAVKTYGIYDPNGTWGKKKNSNRPMVPQAQADDGQDEV